MDYYEFTLPSDSVVAAVMTSSAVDGYLTLLDSSGRTLRSDANSYAGKDALIVQFLAAGTYRLAARGSSGMASSGAALYEVDLRTLPGPRPPFCAPKALGQRVVRTMRK